MRLIAITALVSVPAFAQGTSRVSIDSGGAQGNSFSSSASISADARYVAFQSNASNLVPGDTNNRTDVFVHDRETGVTIRVSVDSNGQQANSDSFSPVISADGSCVAFVSTATNLVPGDTNRYEDVFVHDLHTCQTTRESVSSTGEQANFGCDTSGVSISGDGRYVAFASQSTNLVPVDGNNALTDVFVRDRLAGTTEIASVNSSGAQDWGYSSEPSISGDGRFVAFTSSAQLASGDHYPNLDIYVHDRQTGATVVASVSSSGGPSYGDSRRPSISADGSCVSFNSNWPNLAPGGWHDHDDVYVHELVSGATTRVSVDPSGAVGNGYSGESSLSADGRFVAFRSFATNLVPGGSNGYIHAYVRDRLVGVTTRASVSGAGAQGMGDSNDPVLSADGRLVAFESSAANLVPNDTNAADDVFVRDRGPNSAIAFCLGDGSGAACPCGNSGSSGHGCENSVATGGAILSANGGSSLSADTLVLGASGELSSSLSIFLQGSDAVAPASFGDGLRCAGGTLFRLYTKNASGGAANAPQSGDASVSARSSALGDPIPLGASRYYQTYYRDPNAAFCPAPRGGSFNVSNALAVVWSL